LFSGKKRPLKYKEVVSALKRMGFVEGKKKSTSHVQWRKTINGIRLRVTISAHLSPFSPDLISSIAKQSGVSKNTFYNYCCNKKLVGHPLEI